jgi:predicted ATPase
MKFHENGFQVGADLLKTWSVKQQLKAYQNGVKTNWESPNSTDIHSLKLISNVKSYLTKYLTKTTQENQENSNSQTQERKEIGRSWGASVIISNIKGADTELDSELEENLKKLEKHFPNQVYKGDYFTVIDISLQMIESIGCQGLLTLFRRYLFNQFGYSSQLQL